MTEPNQDQPAETIREVCQQNQAEPAALWDALEAKGIAATPGVVYQALAAGESPPTTEKETGLTADDMAVLSALAAKAGGVEQLARILAVWQDTVR